MVLKQHILIPILGDGQDLRGLGEVMEEVVHMGTLDTMETSKFW